MKRAYSLVVIAVFAAGCNSHVTAVDTAATHPTVTTPSPTATPSPAPRTTHAPTPSPASSLRQLAAANHATYVAGPKSGPAGLFAAYSVVRSISAVHDPGNTLTLLRWTGGHWKVDGQLRAVHDNGYWDFPENDLAADTVVGASSEAPVFDGAEGEGGGTGFLVAVRRNGHWLWARFSGCPVPGQCPPLTSASTTAHSAYVERGRVVGVGLNCQPSCAASSKVYRNEFTWNAPTATFVLTRQTLQSPR
jgi:hypothetical protein